MANPNPTPPPEHSRFKAGQSANPGGKTAPRRKLERKFLEDLHDAWDMHGKRILERVIEERPQDVLKAVSVLLPRQIDVNDAGAVDRERAARLLELVNRRLEELAGVSASGTEEAVSREPLSGLSTIQ